MTLSAHLRNVFSDARHSGTSHLVFKMGKRNSSLFCFLSAGKSIEPTAVLGRIFRCTEPQKTVIPKLETRNANILVLRTVHRTCPTRRAFRRSVSATENAPPEKNISAFRGGHRKYATRKKQFGVHGWPHTMPNQNNDIGCQGGVTKNARPEKQHAEQQKKPALETCVTRKKHSGVHSWPSRVRDQKKIIPAFMGGHRKCPTRKKTTNSGNKRV